MPVIALHKNCWGICEKNVSLACDVCVPVTARVSDEQVIVPHTSGLCGNGKMHHFRAQWRYSS